MSAVSTLRDIIEEFDLEKFHNFFRQKNENYRQIEEDFYQYETDLFTDILLLGEIDNSSSEKITVCSIRTLKNLTEKSGKKAQYELARKILKNNHKYKAGIFIFYDENGNFRFSLVYDISLPSGKRDWSNFRRFTYFVSKEQPNKTFLKQIGEGDFSNFSAIKEAFSVEPLTKEFYQKIAEAFYKLVGGKVRSGNRVTDFSGVLKLPGYDINTNKNIYQEFAVRLIGRTIFVWFLKNKTSKKGVPLIPKEWLSSKKVKETKDYYHNLLEKLFFEILNKPLNERIDRLPDGHEHVPFLNGGLFEPSNDDFYETGFAGVSKFLNTLVIPDEWILEFFKTLEQFNFTIDENSISDKEVSIDPEMLGTIFQNLLAEIDPETEKTARKSTGSFYTPKEIVDYMVEEALIIYLQDHTKIELEKLKRLFNENEFQSNIFTNEESVNIIDAFDSIKIFDPACGSGAFLIGSLHKINIALEKLDPKGDIWKEKQLEKIKNIAFRKVLKNKLEKSNVDYIRKLGIIQNSIYGVDIQEIATEISKLRCFLSLIVDENIHDNADNRGIFPLPNLEFNIAGTPHP